MGNLLNATKIDLSNQGLTEVPTYIFRCKNLKVLDLSKNKIKEIPVELGSLKYLKKLDVSNNCIKQVLSKTFDLEKLEILNLSNNLIRSLPKQIGGLKKLKKLFLSGNRIESLPTEFGEMEALQSLNISKNSFKTFPAQIFQLPTLTSLWVSRNEFDVIPVKDICEKLSNLKAFYAFTPLIQNSNVDRNTILLMKRKGNLINDLTLMTYNSTSTSIIKKDYSTNKEISKNIFISYSHNDEEFKKEVVKTLNGLINIYPDLKLDLWSDDRIRSGQEWLKEIQTAIENASIAILIISRNFIASDFIMKTEVPSILKTAEANGTIILNLIAGKCILSENISKFQFINPPNEPLKSLNEHQQDVIYTKLAEDVSFYLTNPS